MSDNPPQKKKSLLKVLPFLEVGVFEISFVAVILLLLFGILNYFNILSISDVFPNQLGWLPRKEVSTDTSPTNFTPAQQKVPTGTFQYDTKKAETLLTKYIKDTIRPEFLPSKLEIKQGLTIDGRTEDIKYEFGSSITASDATISVNFHYKENSNMPNDYVIFIQPSTTQTTATASLANSLLLSYFAAPYTISDCQARGGGTSCENFQIIPEGKKGYGVLVGSGGNIIFTCFIPKESKDYESFSSCLAQ